MDPERPDYLISDVVIPQAGRDTGELFYVIGIDGEFLLLADGKHRTLEKPKRKKRRHVNTVLRSETRVAAKLLSGDKVLNSELRKDLAYLRKVLAGSDLGGF